MSNTPQCMYPCSLRDGGLKRAKVNNAFKEELQKLYSKVLVGDHEDQSERMETQKKKRFNHKTMRTQ